MKDPQKQLEELLYMEKLKQKIFEQDLEALSPVELKLEYIKLKKDGRKAGAEKRKRAKIRRKNRLARTQRYHQRQNVQRYERAVEGDWWPIVRTTWRKRKLNVSLTEEEWDEHVSPHIPVGDVFDVRRVDTSRGISLDNIMLINHNGVVLFDGTTHTGLIG